MRSAWTCVLTLVATVAFPSAGPVSHANPTPLTASVLRVVDGDTIDVRDDVRGRLRIRILGIDTPETKKPGFTVGCWGPEATAFANEKLAGQRVSITYDESQDLHDRFGRTLAFISTEDGANYSVEAARGGAAHAYVFGHRPSMFADDIAAAETEARDDRRGLWGEPCNGHTDSVHT